MQGSLSASGQPLDSSSFRAAQVWSLAWTQLDQNFFDSINVALYTLHWPQDTVEQDISEDHLFSFRAAFATSNNGKRLTADFIAMTFAKFYH